MERNETPEARGHRMIREAGYSDTGKPKEEKRARGGRLEGEKSKGRPDRRAMGGASPMPKPEGKGKGKGKPVVNIKIGAGGGGGNPEQAAQQGMAMGRQQGMKIGAALGARAASRGMAGGPPPGGGGGPPPMPAAGPPTRPPGGGMPGGMPPGGPPGQGGPPIMKRGGGVQRARGGKIKEEEPACKGGRLARGGKVRKRADGGETDTQGNLPVKVLNPDRSTNINETARVRTNNTLDSIRESTGRDFGPDSDAPHRPVRSGGTPAFVRGDKGELLHQDARGGGYSEEDERKRGGKVHVRAHERSKGGAV